MTSKPALSPWLIGLGVMTFLIIVALFDYLTRYKVEFFVFYAVAAAIATWLLGPRAGVLVSMASASLWYFLDQKLTPPDTHWIFPIWGASMKCLAYLIMVMGTSWLRQLLRKEQEARLQLAEALSEVRELKGLLPICAWCKKVRDDRGYWSGIENYISARTRASFTHSICPACRGNQMGDLVGDGGQGPLNRAKS